MATKVVLVLNGSTQSQENTWAGAAGAAHGFGFTESFYLQTSDVSAIKTLLQTEVAPKRAAILVGSLSVAYARLYISGGGKGILIPLGLPGVFTQTDVANVGLLWQTNNANAPAQSRKWLHGIPDNMVVGGEFSPTQNYRVRLQNYFDTLLTAYFRGNAQTNLIGIQEIASDGTVTFTGNNPFSVGNYITIARTLLDTGRRKGGLFSVASIGPGAAQLKLSSWQYGHSRGGTAYIKTPTFYQIFQNANVSLVRIGTRRVGRPFGLYRGRRSKRA